MKLTISRLSDGDFVSSESFDFSGEVDSDGVPSLRQEVALQQTGRHLHRGVRLERGVQNAESFKNINLIIGIFARIL